MKYLGQEQQAGVEKTILPMTENIHIPIMRLTNIIPQNERFYSFKEHIIVPF